MDWLVHARQRVFTRFEHIRLANLQGTQGVRTKCQIQGVRDPRGQALGPDPSRLSLGRRLHHIHLWAPSQASTSWPERLTPAGVSP